METGGSESLFRVKSCSELFLVEVITGSPREEVSTGGSETLFQIENCSEVVLVRGSRFNVIQASSFH